MGFTCGPTFFVHPGTCVNFLATSCLFCKTLLLTATSQGQFLKQELCTTTFSQVVFSNHCLAALESVSINHTLSVCLASNTNFVIPEAKYGIWVHGVLTWYNLTQPTNLELCMTIFVSLLTLIPVCMRQSPRSLQKVLTFRI